MRNPDQAMQAKPLTKQVWKVIRTLFSVVLLGWIIRRANFAEIGTALTDANLSLIALAVCMPVLGSIISVLRWYTLLLAQATDGQTVSISYLVQSYFVGRFFNNFLPSTIGGDAVRVYDVYRAGFSKSAALTTTLLDRGIGLVMLVLVGCFALLVPSSLTTSLTAEFPQLRWLAVALIIASAIGLLIFLRPTGRILSILGRVQALLPNRLQPVALSLQNLQSQPILFGRAVLLSLALQLNVIFYFFILARAFAFPIPFGNFLLIVPIVLFLIMLPISINGLGIRSNAFAYFFGLFGVPTAAVLAFTLISYSGTFSQGIIGGICYIFRK